MSDPRSILVRAPNWIGDQILAYPFFKFLRKRYPNARIVSASVPWVSSLQFHSQIDEVFSLSPPFKNDFVSKLKALESNAKNLQKLGEFDLGITLPNSLSSAWLLCRAKVKQRRGYATDGRGILLNEKLTWDADPERHRAQAYADLLSEIDPESRDVHVPEVMSSFDPEKEWGDKDVIATPNETYWVCAPGATADSRRWPIEYFLELGRKLYSRLGFRMLVVGGPKEAKLAEMLVNDEGVNASDFTALGPPSSLWKIFRDARFTLTNESGLAHVASICGSPVHIVCGAADPRRTRPLGPGQVKVSINPVECWPCERNTCSQPAGKQIQCLMGILPERVEEELLVPANDS